MKPKLANPVTVYVIVISKTLKTVCSIKSYHPKTSVKKMSQQKCPQKSTKAYILFQKCVMYLKLKPYMILQIVVTKKNIPKRTAVPLSRHVDPLSGWGNVVDGAVVTDPTLSEIDPNPLFVFTAAEQSRIVHLPSSDELPVTQFSVVEPGSAVGWPMLWRITTIY